MTPLGALYLALPVLAGLLVLLSAAILVRRAWRRRAERRAEARAAPVRPALLAIIAGDAEDGDMVSALAQADEPTWRVIEPTLVGMLGKVRGEGRDMLVRLLVQRGVVARAMRDTGRRGAVRRCRAAELLGAVGVREAVPALVRLLADRDPEVRLVAARALGRVEDPSAATALLGALKGRHRVPPGIVARALAHLGAEAEQAAVAALADPDVQVRAVAADILGHVGAVGAASRLAASLRDDEDPAVRTRAARALGLLGASSACRALEAATATQYPDDLRAAAARALGEIGSKESVPVLRRLLFDASHPVAREAAVALEHCGPTGDGALREVALLEAAAGARPAASVTRAAGYAREAVAHENPARWHEQGGSAALGISAHGSPL